MLAPSVTIDASSVSSNTNSNSDSKQSKRSKQSNSEILLEINPNYINMPFNNNTPSSKIVKACNSLNDLSNLIKHNTTQKCNVSNNSSKSSLSSNTLSSSNTLTNSSKKSVPIKATKSESSSCCDYQENLCDLDDLHYSDPPLVCTLKSTCK